MGIEQRKGNLYYYRKRRDGDRVVSEYVGGGEVAVFAEYADRAERERRDAEMVMRQAEQMSIAEIDRQLDSYSKLVDALMTAELLTMGYHQHNRQWRRRR
jgi:hypothetical protein